jgi:hypothetical protein
MNDEELRKLLQNSLAGRTTPVEVRERIIHSLRPRRRIWIAMSLAAAALVAVTAGAWMTRPARMNPTIARAVEQHVQIPRGMLGHAANSATAREITQTVSEANGRDIEVPGLRDGGFTQLQAHRCQATGWAHVVYANSWLTVSCFILDLDQVDLSGGTRLTVPGIDAYSFSLDRYSVVAVRQSGLAKIWVADLRAENLASIAVDAQQKRDQLQTTVFSLKDRAATKQLNAMLQSTPGIEDILMELSKQEAHIRYDRRRVTPDQIYALLVTNGFAATPLGSER